MMIKIKTKTTIDSEDYGAVTVHNHEGDLVTVSVSYRDFTVIELRETAGILMELANKLEELN